MLCPVRYRGPIMSNKKGVELVSSNVIWFIIIIAFIIVVAVLIYRDVLFAKITTMLNKIFG
jgi:hypothetical protein